MVLDTSGHRRHNREHHVRARRGPGQDPVVAALGGGLPLAAGGAPAQVGVAQVQGGSQASPSPDPARHPSRPNLLELQVHEVVQVRQLPPTTGMLVRVLEDCDPNLLVADVPLHRHQEVSA